MRGPHPQTARRRPPRLEILEDRCVLSGVALPSGYGQIPLSFEVNQGQSAAAVDYLAHGQGYAVFLSQSDAVLSLTNADGGGNAVRMHLVGGDGAAPVEGLDKLAGVSNYLIGDASQWHTDIPNYGKVEYHQVYQGIDLVYYGNQQQLEYDFRVAAGADPGQIQLSFDGATGAEVDDAGRLLVHTSGGDLSWSAPTLYQETAEGRQAVSGQFVVTGPNQVGFVVGAYDPTLPLVIDPTLVYSTYLGGNSSAQANAIAVDGAGHAFVTGYTFASAFPTTSGAFQTTYSGNQSAFVTELNSAGTALVYSTYLGGNAITAGQSIAVDGFGRAFVAGYTSASTFPTTPGALQTIYSGNQSAFATELNANGTALVYSTYLGGNNQTIGNGIAVDGGDHAFVTGYTSAGNFPTTAGSFQAVISGGTAGFVSELNPIGTALVYSTYLGGNTTVVGNSIAVDGGDHAFVTGYTSATNFPTTPGAFQTTLTGTFASFMTEFNNTGSALLASTYLDANNQTVGVGVAVDSADHAYVTGYTYATNFPTTPGAFQTATSATPSAFVTEFNPSAASLVYSTYLGGNSLSTSNGIAVDGSGHAFVAGYTSASNFPTTPGALLPGYPGIESAFMTELSPNGSSLIYSTYLGGTINVSIGTGIAEDSSGHSYVAGYTASNSFPTTAGAFQSVYSGATSAFVTRFDDATTTAISATPLTAAYGQSVTLTATVASVNPTDGTPVGGVVTFTVDGVPQTPAFLNQGVAFFTLPNLSAGSHPVTASYSGSAPFDASSSSAILCTIQPAATSVTLASDFSPSNAGTPVTYYATVAANAPSAATPTGLVQFFDATVGFLGAASLINGVAALTLSNLTAGNHGVHVVYQGNANFATSTSSTFFQIIIPGPTTHFSVSLPFLSVTAGSPSSYTITALDAYNNTATGYTGFVRFQTSDFHAIIPPFDYSLTNGMGTFSATFETAGSQTLSVFDTTNGNINGVSAAVSVFSAAVSHFGVSAPFGATAGTAFGITVTALDPYNNVALGYSGTVHFTSNAPLGNLPANSTLNLGVGSFPVVLFSAGNRTITATDTVNSTITGVSSNIVVNPTADPTFTVSAPASAITGVPFTFTVTAHDEFDNTATLYSGVVHFSSTDPLALLSANTTLKNGFGIFTATLETAGNQTITATDASVLATTGQSGVITTRDLIVSSFTPTPTGFTATFNKPFNPSVINLYDAASANYGAADVTLVGASTPTTPVRGSLLIDPTNSTITFVKTGGVLTPDTYTVTLVSGSNAFKDAAGVALDGNGDGIPGDNYTTTFSVASSSAVVVSISSFARGPDAADNINVPNTTSGGIPIKLSNGGNVTSARVTLNYDPTLLNVSGVIVNIALAGASFTLDPSSTSGHAVLVFSSPTALAAGAATLGGVVAQVPNNALYRNKALLDLSNIQINGGAIAAVNQDGVQAVAYFGDASGNGTFSGLDDSLISRVSSKLDSGFAAFRLLDPVIAADVNGNGRIDSNDASQFAQFLSNNASVPAIPPIPSPAPTITPGGPDPTLSLPTQWTVLDGVATVPVLLDDPHPAGSTGMTEASLALTFDPRVFGVSATDVRLGTIPTSGSGWKLSTSVDTNTGQIGIELYSATPIASSASGSLLEIAFHVLPGAPVGTAAVQLVGLGQVDGQTIQTEVDDDQGAYTLSPTPTNVTPASGGVVPTAAPAISGAVVSANSEDVRPIEELAVAGPPLERSTDNETVVIPGDSGEAAPFDAAATMGSVEASPAPSAPPLHASLAAAPISVSSSPISQILASPLMEQALPGGDPWDALASEQPFSLAQPAEGSQPSGLTEACPERTEDVGAATEVKGDSAFPVVPAFGARSRSVTSAVDELFARWSGGIETPAD
jgi:hypothetical protein